MNIDRPRFSDHIQVEVLSPDLVLVASEEESRALPGRLYPLLVPLIDGTNTVHDIIDGVAGRANALDVRAGLSWLEEDGLIRDARTPSIVRSPGLDHLLAPVRAPLREGSVTCSASSLGAVSSPAFRRALARHGIEVATDGELHVLLVDDYLREDIRPYNRHALETGRSWMIARPSALSPWIGPIFRPGVSACWSCLASMLRENRPVHAFVSERRRQRQRGPAPDAPAAAPAALRASLDVIASHLARWTSGEDRSALESVLLAPEEGGRSLRRHAVRRMPHCPECAERRPTRNPMPSRVRLDAAQQARRRDGGYRTVAAEETVRRLLPLVSPLTGAIGFVEHRGTADVPMVVADHPFRFDREPRHVLRSGGRHRSAGKGLTAAQAEASAMCEALERYSGVFRGDEIRREARFDQLGSEAVHPDRCLGYSRRQYAERDRWNGLGFPKLRVPRPFDPDRAVDWSPAWSLTRDEPRWLPTALCYYGYARDAAEELCPPDSNGNAAGNTLEEAVLQGFLEVVERDAVAMWWYNRSPRPRVGLESFGSAGVASTLDAYAALGRDVDVLDLTGDLGIPVFAALSRVALASGTGRGAAPADPESEQLLLGFGAHLDPDVAVARAITEMGQFLPAARRGAWRRPWTGAPADDAFLRPDPDAAVRGRDHYPRPSFATLAECVAHCVEVAASRGLETLVLDQTRADVGLSVVKVIVPELRHFAARLGPGRLYQVPVELGWRTQPLREEDLNPSHIVI